MGTELGRHPLEFFVGAFLKFIPPDDFEYEILVGVLNPLEVNSHLSVREQRASEWKEMGYPESA